MAKKEDIYREENFIGMQDLDNILERTIGVVEEGRDEVFKLSENSRLELLHREADLLKTQNTIAQLIVETEELERKEKNSRNMYLVASSKKGAFEDKDTKNLYRQIQVMQWALEEKRLMEKNLILRRTTLEFQVRSAREVLKRSETLTRKIGVALDYLTGSILKEFEKAKLSKNLGIQIIKAQEEERKRVSMEIHDGPAQHLANLVIKADYCEKLFDRDLDRCKTEIKSLKNLIRASINDIRRIIFDLMPMSLDDLGLIPTLKHYIDEFSVKEDLKIEFSSSNPAETKISNVHRLSVFRMVQESLSNIKKHSGSKTAEINIEILDNELNLTIVDKGKGFSVKNDVKQTRDGGFGLFGLKERLRLLGGNLKILSLDDGFKGCKIEINIPLKK